MRLQHLWTAAFAATVLTGAAFADVTVSQSNDPTAMVEDEFASLLGAEHKTVAALAAPRLKAIASGPAAATPAEVEAKVSDEKSEGRATTVKRVASGKADASDASASDVRQQTRERAARTAADTTPVLIRYNADWLQSQAEPKGDAQWQCLRDAIYFESRGEALRGQFAVAEVILNRVDSSRYPQTICGVVKQSCQFSYTCDGQSDTPSNAAAADMAGRIARVMIDGAPRALTLGATHFHNRSVRPGWAGRFAQTAAIGGHLFYRQP